METLTVRNKTFEAVVFKNVPTVGVDLGLAT